MKDKTASVYNEIVAEMGDKLLQGYMTSSDEE